MSNVERYPELAEQAERIMRETIRSINSAARTTESEMPYKAQWILEHIIELLEKRV